MGCRSSSDKLVSLGFEALGVSYVSMSWMRFPSVLPVSFHFVSLRFISFCRTCSPVALLLPVCRHDLGAYRGDDNHLGSVAHLRRGDRAYRLCLLLGPGKPFPRRM